MRQLLGAVLLAVVTPASADTPPLEELELVSEHPVAGMDAGNLSGLAWCGDALWAVSDREDDRLYRLDSSATVWQAEAERFVAPPAPVMPLPWGLRMRAWVSGLVRGGHLDFEGISCDAKGNRYLVSETRAAVLQVPPAADAQWLNLPEGMVRQARASGMLLNFNSLFEGIAIDPAGERLWLAAERERRGLVVLHNRRATWRCEGGCVLLSEGGDEASPAALSDKPAPVDFSDLAFFEDKLYTLERQAHRICRRAPATGDAERCWSFAAAALTDERRYPVHYGMAEALSVDGQGAWIGLDNGGHARGDGETRPVVWRFATPTGGWGAAQ